MNGKNLNYSIAGYSVIEDVASGILSIIANFIDRIQAEQTEAEQKMIKKRQMQGEYQQEMIDGMPLEERLKIGNYRF